jgi:hypothetical protein
MRKTREKADASGPQPWISIQQHAGAEWRHLGSTAEDMGGNVGVTDLYIETAASITVSTGARPHHRFWKGIKHKMGRDEQRIISPLANPSSKRWHNDSGDMMINKIKTTRGTLFIYIYIRNCKDSPERLAPALLANWRTWMSAEIDTNV